MAFARTLSTALGACCAAIALALPAAAGAQSFPTKPVKLVVPFPPGGTPDIVSRLISEHMSKTLGQAVIIDNRAGASGNIGAQAVAKSPADGYTLLVCAFSCTVSPSLYTPAPYDLQRDFSPVAMLGTVPSVLVVNPKVPAANLEEFLAYAKASPNTLNAASSGVGGSAHLALELLKNRTGAEITHVPYRGAGQVATDLLGGQVDMYFDNLPASLASIRAGKLRALAVASKERAAAAPDVPTFSEAGLNDFLITPWFGVLAPAQTPANTIQALNQAINAALQDPALSQRLDEIGVVPAPNTPEALGQFLTEESRTWADIIAKNNIKPE